MCVVITVRVWMGADVSKSIYALLNVCVCVCHDKLRPPPHSARVDLRALLSSSAVGGLIDFTCILSHALPVSKIHL